MERIKKKYLFLSIVIGIALTIAMTVIPVVVEKDSQRKRVIQERQEYEKRIPVIYERQLFTDTELQKQVEDFSSSENILELFKQHEKQLNLFAKQCYDAGKEEAFFDVEYVDNKLSYFTTADTADGARTAVKKGTHEYITAFMEYAIESGLVFREWMIEIATPRSIDGDNKTSLRIKIYKGFGLYVGFEYHPNGCEDYSSEYFALGGRRVVRINSHWYYEYGIMEGRDIWVPDPKTLGFFNGKEAIMETKGFTEPSAITVEILSPVEVILFYTVRLGVPIIALLSIFILIRYYTRRKKKKKKH